MNRFFVLTLLLLTFATCKAQSSKPFTIPEVTGWTASEGTFASTGRIVVRAKDKTALTVAQRLQEDAKLLLGLNLSIGHGREHAGDICLRIEDLRALGDEGYQLRISEKAELVAATEQALYWGTRTLLQMMEQSTGHILPCGLITDKPQYAHRGFLLDVGRKYIPLSYLKNLVKVMGYYKMNVLQIHLNDNGFKQYFGDDWSRTQAAFRLQCDTYPGLTARDGSYTKEAFREWQLLAKQYGVEVIPEIDVPAHSLAFVHYRPSLGSKKYGDDHLDLGNPEVYTFLDSLFAEYLGGDEPVFIGERVCIGTDEYSNANQEVVEQFRAFTDHYIRYVEHFGKKAVIWGALTHAKGNTPVKSYGVVMNCWYNGFAQPKDMKALGYDLVSIPDGLVYIVPAAGYYYDYLNIEYLYNNWTPAQIGNVTFSPTDSAVIGGMFAVWNDHVGNGVTMKDIHHRVMPALQTIATKCWDGESITIPFDSWNDRRATLSEAPGVNELGRIGTLPHQEVYQREELLPSDTTCLTEIGWDYTVTFTLNCQKEERGTVLFENDYTKFFLSDPDQGKVGFSREGYLETFNYRLPEQGQVTLSIQGNNQMTRLLVNGRKIDELHREELFVAGSAQKYQQSTHPAIISPEGGTQAWIPQVYRKGAKMYHLRTLVFPLRKAGLFKSHVTNLSVWNEIRTTP